MKILSIDVGIKNLAYCLFEINNKSNYLIKHWDVIDLMNEPVCTYISSDNNQCGVKAKFKKFNECYCKKHAKKHNIYLIPNTELNPIKCKRMKLHDLLILAKTFDIINDDTKINKTDLINKITTFTETKNFDFISEQKCNDINLVVLGRNIMNILDKNIKQENIDCVIIENQIGPIANKMKTIQGMIAQYFIMNNVKTIEFISSSNKLKHWVKKNTSYNERKKLGISITLNLINNNNQFKDWDEIFVKHKKQDDLADCYLQGIWYLQENNLINIKTDIKTDI
jgi:hypothetical protein